MTDKVQKIREEVERLKSQLLRGACSSQIAMETSCKEEAYNEVLSILDTMYEEPVSNPINFEKELYKAFGHVKDFTLGMRIAKWFYDMGKNSQEPVNEDLEEASKNYALNNTPWDDCKDEIQESFKAGAKWKNENLWKPADGDDLPEYEREVAAFQETFPTDVDVPSLFKIIIAHRPNPEGYNGKSITTGEIEHYTPKTYDKGGWNIPNIKYWLDCDLPNVE